MKQVDDIFLRQIFRFEDGIPETELVLTIGSVVLAVPVTDEEVARLVIGMQGRPAGIAEPSYTAAYAQGRHDGWNEAYAELTAEQSEVEPTAVDASVTNEAAFMETDHEPGFDFVDDRVLHPVDAAAPVQSSAQVPVKKPRSPSTTALVRARTQASPSHVFHEQRRQASASAAKVPSRTVEADEAGNPIVHQRKPVQEVEDQPTSSPFYGLASSGRFQQG